MQPTQANSSRESEWVRALSIMAFPLIVFLFLRFLYHEVLELRIGFGSLGTDYDFVPQTFIGGVLFLLFSKAVSELTFNRTFFSLTCITIPACILTTIFIPLPLLKTSTPVFSAWLVLHVCAFASCTLSVVPVSVFRKNGAIFIRCALLSLSSVISYYVFRFSDSLVTSVSGRLAYTVLKPLYSGLSVSELDQAGGYGLDHYFQLTYHNLTISIGRGCNGTDGMVLAFFCLGLFCLLRPMPKKAFLKMLALSSIYMFLVNILRIAVLFSVVHLVQNRYGVTAALEAIHGLFHSMLGFVSSAGALAVFYGVVVRRKFKPTLTTSVS